MTDIRLTAVSNSLAETYGRLEYVGPGPFLSGKGTGDLLCGQCNIIVGKSTGGLPPFVNAVTRCPNCQTYQHLTKPSRYSRPIERFGHLADATSPPLTFSATSLWAEHDLLGKNFVKLSDQLLEDWYQHQQPIPRMLYHYTNSAGLLGILNSGTIWASDLAYLNDASEMQYAVTMVSDIYDEVIEEKDNDIVTELLRRATLNEAPLDASSGFYSTCFCTDDDLLSQWRAYGEGFDGYSIAFDAYKFCNPAVRLRKVIYDPLIQRTLIRSFLGQIVDYFLEQCAQKTISELDADRVMPAFSAFLRDHMKDFIYSFKHPSFHVEKEWRIIADFSRHTHLGQVDFRNNNGRFIPYLT